MSGLPKAPLGVGVGWRPEIAHWIDRTPSFRLIEVMAEDMPANGRVPEALAMLRARGATVVPHSVSLSLAGAEHPDVARLRAMDGIARKLDSPFVSDHIAFVRAGGLESGHLLPPPLTQDALDVLVENVREAKRHLSVPLALENIATLFRWPKADMDEATFVRELLHRTGAHLLLDVANLYANARNFGFDAASFLDEVPLDRLAYVHIAGGEEMGGLYHDTHAHALQEAPLALLEALAARTRVPGIILERDDRFPPVAELARETALADRAWRRGAAAREA